MSSKIQGRPSDKLNPKTIDPFASGSAKSTFAASYNRGTIPCRLNHGSVKHKLSWTVRPEDVQFDIVLIALAEGLQESVHPYNFIAQNGFQQLLQISDAPSKIVGVLPSIIQPLRTALSSSDSSVVEGSLNALSQLSKVAGTQLNVHLKNLLLPLSRHLRNRSLQDKVLLLLQELESNCGPEALPLIKQKIPTYRSILA